MKDKTYKCPCCDQDISEFVHREIVLHNRRRNVELARKKQNDTPEIRLKLTEASAERLKKWRKKNPQLVQAITTKASHSRTPESFARQSATIKETSRRKTVKFGELLLEAKKQGRELTDELQKELKKQARLIVQKELAAERKAKKRKL